MPYPVYLLILSLAALLRRPGQTGSAGAERLFQIVIPARNEERCIAETVASCREQDYPADRFEVVVIADNCDDSTAALACQAGACVVHRVDPSRRSKGDALTYYFNQIHQSGSLIRLDAVVVIDADTVVDPGLLRKLSAHLDEGHDWIQVYDTVSNWDESWRTRLMTYSFSLINGVRLLGQNALGVSANLCGNGMCLAAEGLRRVPWGTNGLAEDLEFSWTLRALGEHIDFAPEIAVRAAMPAAGGSAAASQRRRWEFGRSQVRRRMFGPILRSPHLRILEKTAAIFELTMPTTVSLALLVMILCIFNFGLEMAAAPGSPFLASVLPWFSCFSVLCLLVYAASPFFLLSLPTKVLSSLLFCPFYAIWKGLTYLGGSPREWVRTQR